MHVASGLEPYQKLSKMCKETGYKLEYFLVALNKGRRPGISGRGWLKGGTLSMTDESLEKARKDLENVFLILGTAQNRLTSQRKKIGFLKKIGIISAALRLINSPNFDLSHMIERVGEEDLTHQNGIDSYLSMFESVYNYRKRDGRLIISRKK